MDMKEKIRHLVEELNEQLDKTDDINNDTILELSSKIDYLITTYSKDTIRKISKENPKSKKSQ